MVSRHGCPKWQSMSWLEAQSPTNQSPPPRAGFFIGIADEDDHPGEERGQCHSKCKQCFQNKTNVIKSQNGIVLASRGLSDQGFRAAMNDQSRTGLSLTLRVLVLAAAFDARAASRR